MKLRTLSLTVSLGLLGACTLGPDYTRPVLGLNPAYRGETPADASARNVSDIAWSEQFRDPELSALLRLAVAGNLDLQIALTRIEAAQAQNAIARSLYLPTLSGGLSTSPNPGANGGSSYSLGAILSWELDIFGKLRRGNEAARAELLASEDGARAVMSSLVATTAGTWLNLRELDRELVITEANVRIQQDSLDLVRAMMRSGVASGAEEQQAIVQLANTEAQVPRLRQAILSTENALILLLGGQPGPIKRNTAAPQPQTPALPAAGLPSELLERRPDVRAAEHQLEAATARIGVAVANRFPVPTIGLGGFFGLVGIDLGDTFSNDGATQEVTSWGPNASLPLVDWGRGSNTVRGARAEAGIAALYYRATVLNALREVSDSMNATQNISAEIAQYAISTQAARKNLYLQRIRFKAGVNSYFEMLDAQRQLFSSELAEARAQRDLLLAHVDLYRALGGGWSDEALIRGQTEE
jgi:multidrug efflux system outer membrane protein